MNLSKTLLSATAVAAVCFTVSASAVPEGWTDDFAAAQTQAAASDKDLLLDFTGSDWCGWCIRLRDEVFDTETFKASAPDDFVFVELDFPNDVPQSDAVKAQNAELAQRFQVQGYPTIVLADAEGRPYAFTGYQEGGAEAYLAHLEALQGQREARDAGFEAAASAEGLDKARALDAAMDAVGLELAVAHYNDTVEQIVALDPEDEAGLKSKYQSALQAGQLEAAMQGVIGKLQAGDFEGGLAEIDRVIADYNPQNEELQVIRAMQGQVNMQIGNVDAAVAALEQSLAAAPESPIAPQVQMMLEQIEAMAAPAAAE